MLTLRSEVIEDGTKIHVTGADTSTTIRYAKTQSLDRNLGKAVGTHLAKLLHGEQQSRLRHPSGAQRVVVSDTTEFAPRWEWYIDV